MKLPHFCFDDAAQDIFVEWCTELHTVHIANEQNPQQILLEQNICNFVFIFEWILLDFTTNSFNFFLRHDCSVAYFFLSVYSGSSSAIFMDFKNINIASTAFLCKMFNPISLNDRWRSSCYLFIC